MDVGLVEVGHGVEGQVDLQDARIRSSDMRKICSPKIHRPGSGSNSCLVTRLFFVDWSSHRNQLGATSRLGGSGVTDHKAEGLVKGGLGRTPPPPRGALWASQASPVGSVESKAEGQDASVPRKSRPTTVTV